MQYPGPEQDLRRQRDSCPGSLGGYPGKPICMPGRVAQPATQSTHGVPMTRKTSVQKAVVSSPRRYSSTCVR